MRETILALACLLGAIPQETPELRWKFEKGTKFRHEICLISRISLGTAAPTVTMNGLGAEFAVLDVDERGTATLSVVYDRQIASQRGTVHDTDAEDKSNDPKWRLQAGLVGTSFKIRVSRTGQVDGVDGFSAVRRKSVESLAAADREAMAMSDADADALAATLFAQTFFGLPEKAASTWEGTLPAPAPVLNGMAISTVNSLAYRLPDGRHVLFQTSKAKRAAAGAMSELTLSGSGRATWDAKTGRVARMVRVQTIRGLMDGDPLTIELEQHAWEAKRPDEASRAKIAAAIGRLERSSEWERDDKAVDEILAAGDAALLGLLARSESRHVSGLASEILEGAPLAKSRPPDERFGGRMNLMARGGGTSAANESALNGLRWLARHQAEDGSWGARCGTVHAYPGSCEIGAGDPVRDTGFALLALSGGGYSTLSRDEYDAIKMGAVVERGQAWLHTRQDADGWISKDLASHAIALLALADEPLDVPAESRRAGFLIRGVQALESARTPGKGWKDAQSTAWALWALWAAQGKGIPVREKTIPEATAWLATQEGGSLATFALMLHGVKPADTHVAKAFDAFDKADAAAWHVSALVTLQADGHKGDRWKAWNRRMLETLVKGDAPKEKVCSRGSWDPATVGVSSRVSATAFAVMTLECYYRYPVPLK